MRTENVSRSTLTDPLHKYRRAIEWLTEARELIQAPYQWTQHASARDSYGNRTLSNDKDAVCWCASGAVCRILLSHHAFRAMEQFHMQNALNQAAKELCGATERGYVYVNDSTDHATVLKMFDRAIQILKERP